MTETINMTFSDENIHELKKIAEDAKHGRNMHEHELIGGRMMKILWHDSVWAG